MKDYRVVKSSNGWNIEKKLPDNLAKLIVSNHLTGNVVYDVIARDIADYTEAEKRAKALKYSELSIGEVAIEF
jgi:hypothetical protein